MEGSEAPAESGASVVVFRGMRLAAFRAAAQFGIRRRPRPWIRAIGAAAPIFAQGPAGADDQASARARLTALGGPGGDTLARCP